MALHHQLPIHRTGSQLLGLAATIHAQMPRGFKRTIGDKIVSHCGEMLVLTTNAIRQAEAELAEMRAHGNADDVQEALAHLERLRASGEAACRVLDAADPFCPKCGHNRDRSSVSTIDHGDGRRSCQKCGAEWVEPAAGVPGTPLAADSDPEKRPDFYTWTWDVEIGGGRWEARYGWKKPVGAVHNLKPLFTHGAGGKSNG